MTGTYVEPDPNPATTITLGCEPLVTLTLYEDDGNVLMFLTGDDLTDFDGLFFDMADGLDSSVLQIYPEVNVENVTGFETGSDDVDSLDNGATLAEGYDAGIQFGTVPDSTTGEVTTIGFTFWPEDGVPLTFESFDLESFAAVINSDGEDGQVLLVNDGEGGTGEGEEDGVCSFLIEGDVNVEVTLTELENGDMQVDLEVLTGDNPEATGQIGDLRGLFFDIDDESLLDGLSVSGDDVTASDFDANSVTNLGNGANLNGQHHSYDGGVEIGTQGASGDDIQSTSFVLSHDTEDLSLEDFAEQQFGLRLTSVGGEGEEDREGSLKLTGECIPTSDPVCDDQYALGDLLPLTDAEETDSFGSGDDDLNDLLVA